MKRLISLLVKCIFVILLVTVVLQIYSNYLDKQIELLYEKNAKLINHWHGLAEKDKGNVLMANTLKNGNMLFIGSSEFTSPVPENPKNLFPNNLYNGDVTFTGHATVQNALQAINIGSNYDSMKDSDIMIVESLQWFMDDEINIQGFFSNFSELQFYEFLHNERISEENKLYLCNRYVQLENMNITKISDKVKDRDDGNVLKEIANSKLLSGVVDGSFYNKQTYILARLYSSENIVGKIIYQMSRPYYWLRYKILSLKDRYQTYKLLKELDDTSESNTINIDWDELDEKAEKEGKSLCTNNSLYVADSYYSEYLEDGFDSKKDYRVNTPLMTSKEWGDFKFFLSVCKELEMKPYITIMSTNGLYYDYIGITKEKRDEYYNQVENMANDSGFETLSLKDYEYTPYFYYDVMHLGWKGWPYVIRKTIEHFTK